jgi:chromosome segregation ATPase
MNCMDETTKTILDIVTDIQEDVTDIRKRMATKDDIAHLQEQINNHTRQIEANTKAVAELSEQIRNVLGFAKEIDVLITRVSTLEKQVETLMK